MNLVGKIFVVLITVMSFVFMAFALSVYATHQNWRLAVENPESEVAPGKPLGLKFQLETANKRKTELQDELDKLKKQREEEKLAQRQALAKLESQRAELTVKHDELQKVYDALLAKDKIAIAAVDTAQNTLEKLTKEVEGLRKEIRVAQDDRDKQFRQVVDANDTINQVQGELKRVKEREQQVAAQVAKWKDMALKYGWNLAADDAPADLHGKVVAISGEDMVEVSIGKDDGLKAGDTLEVFRGTHYLGRLKIVRLDTNRSVGQILREFRSGPIQKGDDVTTRLKLG